MKEKEFRWLVLALIALFCYAGENQPTTIRFDPRHLRDSACLDLPIGFAVRFGMRFFLPWSAYVGHFDCQA
jgi:hypothetical protein